MRFRLTPPFRQLIKKSLTDSCENTLMRVVLTAVVALIALGFADEHFNEARYVRAATAMLSQIVQSFG